MMPRRVRPLPALVALLVAIMGTAATAWHPPLPYDNVAGVTTDTPARQRGAVGPGRGRGRGAQPRVRKALLAWADTRNGIAQHAFTSHALSVIEQLG